MGSSGRIAINELVGVTWLRVWKSANATAMLGRTPGHCWLAWHSRRGKAYAFYDERGAADLLDRWFVRGDWQEIDPRPAETAPAA